MSRKVAIYGVEGRKTAHKVVKYWVLRDEEITINEMNYVARNMVVSYPSVAEVYVMDTRDGLYRDYKDAVKANSMEGWIMFYDILEREAHRWTFVPGRL